jgi:uncharacterized protein DUF4259
MGTWAEGNFENDGALDYVGELIDSLSARVEEILADEERSLLDEEGEAVLVPSVEIISILCERCKAAPPKEKTVKQWHKRYLQLFDEQIGDLDPEGGFEAARRQVIENTFKKLEDQARRFWKKA